jgi:hypothetical protein
LEIVGEWTEPCVNAANEQLFRQDQGEFLTLIRATLSVGYFSQAETVIMGCLSAKSVHKCSNQAQQFIYAMNTSGVLVVLITIACDAGDVHNCDIAEINEIGFKRRLQSQHLHQRGCIKTKKRGSSVTMAIH